jgi:hypothetical protein
MPWQKVKAVNDLTKHYACLRRKDPIQKTFLVISVELSACAQMMKILSKLG